jgi:phosphoglycolate phosphatase
VSHLRCPPGLDPGGEAGRGWGRAQCPCYIPRMAFRLVIFDYDGTLADSGQWFVDNVNRFAIKHGFRQVKRDEIELLRGMPTRDVVRHLGVKRWRMPFIAADMRQAVAEPGGTPKLFAGVDELLARVQAAGIRIALVSSNSEANVRVGLGPSNAARIDDFECGVSLFGKAGKLKRLARRRRLPGAEVLCVGDDTRDIEAGRLAKLEVAAVTWGYASERVLAAAGPDFLVHDMDELAAAIGLPPAGGRGAAES